MKQPRPVVHAVRWCGSCAGLLACWAVWLVLGGLLAVQVWIATHRELPLPDFALRAVEQRLAASKVSARFGRAVFDPTGRVVLQDVRLYSPTYTTPLLTIRAAYVRVDFWALLVGNLRLGEVRLTGVNLHVPAMVSPSGTDESVVSDLGGVFSIGHSDYTVDLCTFHLGRVAVAARGTFHLPAAVRPHPGSLPLLDLILQRYLKVGRRLLSLRPRLDALQQPRLQLVLTPSASHGALVDATLFVRGYRGNGPIGVSLAEAHATFPLLGNSPVPARATVQADQAEWNGQAEASTTRVELTGTLAPDRMAFTAGAVQLSVDRGTARGVPFIGLAASLNLEQLPKVSGRLSCEVDGAPIDARGTVDLKHRDGSVALAGLLTEPLLRRAESFKGLTAARWVELSEPAEVTGTVHLAAGWKPTQAEGDVSVDHVIAHEVPLDRARAHVLYRGHSLRATDLFLRQGDNVARGSYTMDTKTRDYRFLLKGRLRPLDISGWFHDWWPRFWNNFDFSAAPATADVDVTGRWRDPRATTVFCHADVDHPGIRGVSFSHARATLFVRPFYFDVFDFRVDEGDRSAHGSFTLSVVPHRPEYRTLVFDAVSDLDPRRCATMYGPAGLAYVEPYTFKKPPHLHLAGHLLGPGEPGGRDTRIDLTLLSPAAFAYHRFAFADTTFTAAIHNHRLDLRDVKASFAGGHLTGHALLDGTPPARRLSFGATLKGADLAQAIAAAIEYQAEAKPAAKHEIKAPLLSRTAGGRLDTTVTAAGRFGQPFSFHGNGTFTIQGRELGEIHLLGLLSEMLNKNHLNFTSLRLDAAKAAFKIEGPKLAFSQVKLTGPTAAIEAKGDYRLDTHGLDFNANVFPLQQSGFLPADLLSFVLTPLSIALELRLTGTIEKPSWALLLGPTNILRTLTKPLIGGAKTPAAKEEKTPVPATRTAPSVSPP